MSISEVAARVSPPDPLANSSSGGSGIVDKDDFLQLLVTQMQHQDPLNPQDPAQFTAQLAQFSSLEQLIEVNASLQSLGDQQTANERISASNYIGHNARILGTMVQVNQGEATPIRFETLHDSAAVSLTVYNADGVLVDYVDLGPYEAGSHDYQWNGILSDGSNIADGTYRIELNAVDGSGEAISTQTSFAGEVTSVFFDRNQTLLEIGGLLWPMDSLLGIGELNAS
jgi:flagellar basal-body rod modification protein FlgD